MPLVKKSFWRPEDTEFVYRKLLEVRKNELVAREVLPLNTEAPSFSHTYTVENLEETGQAQIVESGNNSDDLPFVGEQGGSVTGKLFIIQAGMKITQDDLDSASARREMGKGNPYPVSEKRLNGARRFIAENENRISFHGLKTKDGKKIIKHGLFNFPGVSVSGVSAIGTLNSPNGDEEKRLLSNMTPIEKLKTFLGAKKDLEKSGKFKAKVCLLSDEDYLDLLMPYSDSETITTLDWLLSKKDILFPGGFVRTQDLNPSIVKFKGTGNNLLGGFVVMENTSDVVELIEAQELNIVTEPMKEIEGYMRIKAYEKIGGVHVHRPEGIIVKTGTSRQVNA